MQASVPFVSIDGLSRKKKPPGMVAPRSGYQRVRGGGGVGWKGG